MKNYAVGETSIDMVKTPSSPDVKFSLDSSSFGVSDADIRRLNSSIPVAILEPEIVKKRAELFEGTFPGRVMYAVKCNPDPIFLKAMYAGGVNCFDAASLSEIKLIRELLPFTSIYFMHPIKAPEAIFEAYHSYNVNAFVLDYQGELDKICAVLPEAEDLELFIRIAVPKGNVATDFSTKFGAKFDEAVALLKNARSRCVRLGVSFHVGTQCTDPGVYKNAVGYAADVIKASGVEVEALDVGGGFPTTLDVNKPAPSVEEYTDTIVAAVSDAGLGEIDLLCEVGRGLVADAGSLVVRVEGRKNELLYINDGTYGGLFEAGGAIGLPYPARLIRREEGREASSQLMAFRFAGPTCDSVDMMNGPFMLPEDVQVGDWIALDKLGAYGEVSRTDFNGFGKVKKIVIDQSRPSIKPER